MEFYSNQLLHHAVPLRSRCNPQYSFATRHYHWKDICIRWHNH